jgi:hypothetical protein
MNNRPEMLSQEGEDRSRLILETRVRWNRFNRIVIVATSTAAAVVCVALSVPNLSSMTTPSGAEDSSNPPWFPSLMAFEHYDSGRTKLFERAHFAGSFDATTLSTCASRPTFIPRRTTACISVRTRSSFSEARTATEAGQAHL